MTVGQISDSHDSRESRDIGKTTNNELGDNEKVETEESDSTLENENVTIAPNATIIPDPTHSNEQKNKNEQNNKSKNQKIIEEKNRTEQKIMDQKSENSKMDNRPTKIDDARIVWTKLISNCLAIVRVAVDLFSSGKGFSKATIPHPGKTYPTLLSHY